MALVARVGALTDIGLHRKTNEDAFVVAPPLYAVCDGMGGAQAGEVASALAADTLAGAVEEGLDLLAAAELANAAVHAHAAAHSERSGMGTTLTALLLKEHSGLFAHIGDSRAYLLRGRDLRQLSDDHSLVAEMMRQGRITEEEAALHPHRSVLTRALGTEPTADIDEFEAELRDGDVLLLCSDGLSSVVSARAIRKALDLEDPRVAAAKLIADARRHGGPDNITAVVVRLDEPEPSDEARTLAIPLDEMITAAGAAPVSEAGPTTRLGRRRLGVTALVLGLLVAVAGLGAVTLSTVFFVGVEDGDLTVYSGLPASVGPVPLHAVYRRSARTYVSLTPDQRRLVDERRLHDRTGVIGLSEHLGMWP